VHASARVYSRLFATGLTFAVLIACADFVLAESCKPNHLKAPYFLNDMGPCSFNADTLSFAGTPAEQAMCLMRGMDDTRNLAPPLHGLPSAIADRAGETTGLPSREVLSGFLSKQDLEWDFAAHLWEPISRGRDNDPDSPMARYFVIHDTSGPLFGRHGFPGDIDDESAHLNNLKNFTCADGWGKAHIVVNRAGGMLVDHDFGIPWRETKFEQAAEFGGALKGLFVHIELIQPRRAGRGGDGHSPDPAFTAAQYDRLALLYVIASVRAEQWLIPAFHAALDANIRDGHDDPLNFDIESFAKSIEREIEKLGRPDEIQAAHQ
jgi:hypothetical protein